MTLAPSPRKACDEALGLGGVFRSGHSAGQQHGVRAHRGNVHLGFWHGESEHLIDAANVRTNADIG